jgi:hypothetical protein
VTVGSELYSISPLLRNTWAMQETQVVGGQWFCAYAAVSVAVISRQICRL